MTYIYLFDYLFLTCNFTSLEFGQRDMYLILHVYDEIYSSRLEIQ